MSSPIGWVVLAIGALVAGIAIAWKKFACFREAVLGLWYAFKQVFTNIGNFFKMIFEPIFKAIAAIKEGKWGEAAKQTGLLLYNLSPVGLIANVAKFTAEGGLTKGVADAFRQGKEQQRARDAAKKQQEIQANATMATAGVATAMNATGASTAMAPAVAEVAASSGPKVFNININKLVERLDVVTNTMRESPEQIRELITKALLEAVNDANAVVL
jgi:hypothetical protein